jgi:uncharacterized protein YuzE
LENAVKVIYDKETDTLSIILRSGKVVESDEAQEGLILDYDNAGRLVSLELLDASEKVHGPQTIEFALAANERIRLTRPRPPSTACKRWSTPDDAR